MMANMGRVSDGIPFTRRRTTSSSDCPLTRYAMLVPTPAFSSGMAVGVVLDISLKPKQGSQVLIQHGGGTELATLRGRALITEDGEAIEGEADDVSCHRVVTFTICDVRRRQCGCLFQSICGRFRVAGVLGHGWGI